LCFHHPTLGLIPEEVTPIQQTPPQQSCNTFNAASASGPDSVTGVETLMDSKTLILTANSETVYAYGWPESNINGKEKYPVVQIAYPDADAYAKWAGLRPTAFLSILPTNKFLSACSL
jgi:formylglycine-generating enzyme required for sulfatase activity